MNKKIAILLLILGLFIFAGCSNVQEDDKGLLDVTVMLDWFINTNHTGMYVALDKGWYEDEGLNVEIIEPAEGGTSQLVASGKAHFGVSYQEDVTQARANDIPIVSIAAVLQHNTSGFASKKETGIERPKDMEGKIYGGWGSPTEEAVLKAVMKNDNADFNKVEVVNIGTSDFFTAIEREMDFAWIYYGWTGVEAELKGIDLNFIELRDLDENLDYYTPVLITSEALIKDNQEVIRKFLNATKKGYEFAIENPEEAATILLKYAPELDEKLVLESQKYMSPRYKDDAEKWGIQKREVWERYAKWMYDHKVMDKMINVDEAFTNDFLE